MAVNPFDKACRYAAKLESVGFVAWLLGDGLTFRAWLDARRLSFPGQPDRVCDTVALLAEANGQPWAVPVEFQIQPDPELFGRLLGYLGSLWLEFRPDPEPGSRYHVAAAVVNLTGRGQTSRDLRLRRAKLRTCLQVGERNLETESAAALLGRIARGQLGRGLLPWIPLLRGGGELGIIRKRLKLAAAEPDQQRRGDYAALALVFAEAAGRRDVWRHHLEGWNMIESQQVLEWQEEARVQTRREDLQLLLEDRFGPLPATIRERLQAVKDPRRLQQAILHVHRMQSLDDLVL